MIRSGQMVGESAAALGGKNAAEALEAIRKAVELNPANRQRLPRNPAFEPLTKDPEFLRIIGR
jgi:hypothetical protein